MVGGSYELYALVTKRAYNYEYLFIIDSVIKLDREYRFEKESNRELVFVIPLRKHASNDAVTSVRL